MDYKKNIPEEIFNLLYLSKKFKMYYSNIGFIIVPYNSKYIYKIFNKIDLYEKELKAYNLLNKYKILIPNFKDMGKVSNFFVLELENIRRNFKRKEFIEELGLNNVARLISKIHNIEKHGKNFLLGDIHVSNFFEKIINGNIELGIFDFSSSSYGDIEQDLCNLYIDLGLNNIKFNIFLENYYLKVNFIKLYKYSIKELYERIKNGMNLDMKIKIKYMGYLKILKEKLGNLI